MIAYTDTPDNAVGACLVQPCTEGEMDLIPNVNNEKPVVLLSHRLSKSQRKWKVTEKETFAYTLCYQKVGLLFERN